MPLFEFVCRSCGKPFETLVSGAREIVCPACASADVEKRLSVFAVGKSAAGENLTCGSSECGYGGGGCDACGCAHG